MKKGNIDMIFRAIALLFRIKKYKNRSYFYLYNRTDLKIKNKAFDCDNCVILILQNVNKLISLYFFLKFYTMNEYIETSTAVGKLRSLIRLFVEKIIKLTMEVTNILKSLLPLMLKYNL